MIYITQWSQKVATGLFENIILIVKFFKMNNNLIRRSIYAFSMMLVSALYSMGQGCDPQITVFDFADDCNELGVNSTLTVQWTMGGGDPTCSAPANSFTIQINLPASGVYGVISAVDVVTPSVFDWVLEGDGHTLTGTNNSVVDWFAAGEIIVDISMLTDNGCTALASNSNIQIIPSVLGGSPSSFVNNTGNDVLDDNLATSVVLPVEFSSFKAKNENCEYVNIEWKTQSEINNSGFYVERSIGSANNFENIVFVEGSINTQIEQRYSFEDDIASIRRDGNVYYRITQVDLDGRTSSTEIVSVELDCQDIQGLYVRTYPNPTIDELFVDFEGGDEEVTGIVIRNNLNKLIASIDRKNDDQMILDLSSYTAGIYYIQVIDARENVLYSDKVIKLGN